MYKIFVRKYTTGFSKKPPNNNNYLIICIFCGFLMTINNKK